MTIQASNNFDVSRFVVPVSERILIEKSHLAGIALANARKKKIKSLTSTKPEFKEYFKGAIKEKIKTGITANYFDSETAKTLNIDTKNILVGDILSFQDKKRKYKGDLRVIVTEITDNENCKVLHAGGNKDITLEEGDFAFVSTNAHPEGSKVAERRPLHLPHTVFNYTQIVRGGHIVTGTAISSGQYDFVNLEAELKERAVEDFTNQLGGIVTSGVRNILNIAGKEHRVAGGLFFFALNEFDNDGKVVGNSTGNVDNSGGKITIEKIDNGFQYLVENGGKANAIITSPEQARKISYLQADKINVNVINGTNPGTQGGATNIIKSPIDFNGNMITHIFVDTSLPKDVVIMFNTDALYLIPMENRASLQTVKIPNSDFDAFSMDLLGEWTCRFENAKQNSYIITGLEVK